MSAHTNTKIKNLIETLLNPFRVPDITEGNQGMHFTSQNTQGRLSNKAFNGTPTSLYGRIL